jgi:hypothetical protein
MMRVQQNSKKTEKEKTIIIIRGAGNTVVGLETNHMSDLLKESVSIAYLPSSSFRLPHPHPLKKKRGGEDGEGLVQSNCAAWCVSAQEEGAPKGKRIPPL